MKLALNVLVSFLTTFIIAVSAQASVFMKDIPKDWKNLHVSKLVDASKTSIHEVYNIDIENISEEPVSEYYIPYLNDDGVITSLVIVSTNIDSQHQSLPSTPVTGLDNNGYSYIVVSFPTPLAPGSKQSIQVQKSLIKKLRPIPDILPLDGIQSVSLNTSRYLVSPYITEDYDFVVKGADAIVSDLDKKVEIQQADKKSPAVVYQGLSVSEPFKIDFINLFYERNKPILVNENLKRDIWISHWGDSVSFEEKYEFINNVGKLPSSFSRLNWMNNPYSYNGGPFVLGVNVKLPSKFRDAYFVDYVGNVSTSTIVNDMLVLKPRFPLFGGWKYNFTIGWNNDLKDIVRESTSEDDVYYAIVPLINGPYDISYSKAEISFYLPEGAELIDISSALSYKSKNISYEKSYLDFQGHTKVTLQFENLIDDYSSTEVIVKYKYSTQALFKKPLLISGFLFIGLISYFLLGKIDVAIDQKTA